MIQRSDLESKFREIMGAVDETKASARSTGMMIAAGVVVLIAAAYLIGRRRKSSRLQVIRLV